jgi:pimeloyl-ACP methyl ester carboxylesterase
LTEPISESARVTPADDDLLSFEDVGRGPALVLVHGFPLDREMWWPQIERLSPTHRVIAVDLRGFGQSPNAGAPSLSMRRHAADVVAVLDALELDQVALLGFSMGGYVALALAEFYPERLRSLVLAHTRATPDSAAARTARQRSITEVEEHGVAALSRELPEKLLAAGAPSVLRQSVAAMIDRQEPAAVVAALRGMAERQDRTEVAAGLSMPVLVVSGSADQMVPSAEALGLHATIPGSEWFEFFGAGHLSNLERPDGFAAVVSRFLAQNRDVV